MKLNARQVDAAKPKDKPYKLADGGGLYLLIKLLAAQISCSRQREAVSAGCVS